MISSPGPAPAIDDLQTHVELPLLPAMISPNHPLTPRRNARVGKREIPEKARRLAASSGTITTRENPRADPPGIEPSSPRWEPSRSVLCGATVAERLASSPPTKAIGARSPAGSLRIFACGNRDGGCHWWAGILGYHPLPPPLHSGAAPSSHHVKSLPNLFTYSIRVVRLLASQPGEPGLIPDAVASKFSHVGIVLDYAAGPWFSRISPVSPSPCIPTLLHTHPPRRWRSGN
ncbi:hypothetical protein PR048_027724 [Dryococelus australis]|uniref:Uncharacterized protein n=1 Tax=Dryococelus australis TaxID=614101 RepID=A0ABQ9GHB4_9NEOP|nr:hypothetical protein PR048_027724 [Dryococelus australis]